MAIKDISPIEWEPAGRQDAVLTRFLRTQFTEDTSQRPAFTLGFPALSRSMLVKLAARFDIEIPDPGKPKDEIVKAMEVAWAQRKFGDVTEHLNGDSQFAILSKRLEDVDAKRAEQDEKLDQVISLVSEIAKRLDGPTEKPAEKQQTGLEYYRSLKKEAARRGLEVPKGAKAEDIALLLGEN